MPKAAAAHKQRAGQSGKAPKPFGYFIRKAGFCALYLDRSAHRTTGSARLCPVRLTAHDTGTMEDGQ
jgi:hypothetical protein